MSHQGDAESLAAMLAVLVERGPALRAAGFSSVTLRGVHFNLRAPAPAVLPQGAGAQPIAEDDPDPDDELSAEARELADAERDWKTYWERMTRSSGAPVPPFPGIEKYRKMGALIAGRGH